MNRLSILSCDIDDISLQEAITQALSLTSRRSGAYVVTPNSRIVLDSRNDPRLRQAIKEAAISLPDGIGTVISSRIIGTPISGRVAGIDFASAMLAALSERGGSVFLLGGEEGTAERAVDRLGKLYPGLVFAGCNNGFFDKSEERLIIERINAASPDFLMVCLGSPKQELWMHAHAVDLSVGVMAGLGGTIDVFAGTIERAPLAWRRCGLEWLYRTIKEPWRLKKAAGLPHILAASVWQRIGGN